MSLKAIEEVSQAEQKHTQRKLAAQVEVKTQMEAAKQEGQALLQKVRAYATTERKTLLEQAQNDVAKVGAEMEEVAKGQAVELRQQAQACMNEAVAFVIGKVVSN